MKLFNQTFEYITHNITCPTNADFERLDYDSKEYKNLEWAREYWRLTLNELGAVGWELISIENEPTTEKKMEVKKCIFKRSSRSRYFDTGFGVSMRDTSDRAKEVAEEQHMD